MARLRSVARQVLCRPVAHLQGTPLCAQQRSAGQEHLQVHGTCYRLCGVHHLRQQVSLRRLRRACNL